MCGVTAVPEPYREPYPSLRERLYWLYVRLFADRDVPPKSWVRLSCPEKGDVIATEHTDPVKIDRDVEGGTGVWTYECDVCSEDVHSWLWGPPAPILVEVDDA